MPSRSVPAKLSQFGEVLRIKVRVLRDGFNEDESGSTGAPHKRVVSDARAGLCSEAPRSAPFV